MTPFVPLLTQASDSIRLLAPAQQGLEAELAQVAVELVHADPARWAGGRGLRSAGAAFRKEAQYAGDTATWMRSISRYLASVRSESTSAAWPDAVNAQLFQYPIDWKFTPSGIVDAEGRPVESIDGWPVARLERAIGPWVSVEGRSDDGRNAALWSSLPQFEPVLLGLKTTRSVLIGGKESQIQTATSSGPAVVVQRRPGQVLLVEIRKFGGPEAEIGQAMDQLRRDPGLRLVLDLRKCRGDDLSIPLELLKSLTLHPTPFAVRVSGRALSVPVSLANATELDRPFFRADRFRSGKDGRLDLLASAAPELLSPLTPEKPIRGAVDILIGPGTGVVAAYLAGRLAATRHVRTIGGTASGYVAGFCGAKFLYLSLPESGIRVQIPMLRVESGSESQDRLRPDHAVKGDALGWAEVHPPSRSRD